MESTTHDPFFDGFYAPDAYFVTLDFSPGNSVEVTVSFDDIGDEPRVNVVERARSVYTALQSQQKEIYRALVDEFLAEYNEIGTKQQPLDEVEFVKRIKLTSIFLQSSGLSYLNFLPEELEDYFGDHAISMDVSAEMQIGRMELQG